MGGCYLQYVVSKIHFFPKAALTDDHTLDGFQTTGINPLTVLEVRSLKSRGQQGGVLMEGSRGKSDQGFLFISGRGQQALMLLGW